MKWYHEGLTITLKDEGIFEVTDTREGVEEKRDVMRHASLSEAKDSIERFLKSEAKLKVAEKERRTVLGDDGVVLQVRSLHATTGKVLTTPQHTSHNFYPNVAWINSDIAEIQRLQSEVLRLRKKISAYSIRTSAYGREDLAGRYEQLIKEIDARTEAAKAARD